MRSDFEPRRIREAKEILSRQLQVVEEAAAEEGEKRYRRESGSPAKRIIRFFKYIFGKIG